MYLLLQLDIGLMRMKSKHVALTLMTTKEIIS